METIHCQIEAVFNRNSIIYEVNGDEDKTLLLNEYLERIKPYLKNIINSLNESSGWKTKLSVKIMFISWKDIDENSHEYLWGNSKEIMMSEETDEIIKEIFK